MFGRLVFILLVLMLLVSDSLAAVSVKRMHRVSACDRYSKTRWPMQECCLDNGYQDGTDLYDNQAWCFNYVARKLPYQLEHEIKRLLQRQIIY